MVQQERSDGDAHADPPAENPSSPFSSFSGHHVGIRVPDYDAAKAWYTEKLDFRVLQEWPYGELKLAYLCPPNDDNFHVELLAGPVPFPNEILDDLGVSLQHGGYQHMCVHVDDVDEARAELASRGVDLIGEPFEIEDISRRLAFFPDPWGNMIVRREGGEVAGQIEFADRRVRVFGQNVHPTH